MKTDRSPIHQAVPTLLAGLLGLATAASEVADAQDCFAMPVRLDDSIQAAELTQAEARMALFVVPMACSGLARTRRPA